VPRAVIARTKRGRGRPPNPRSHDDSSRPAISLRPLELRSSNPGSAAAVLACIGKCHRLDWFVGADNVDTSMRDQPERPVRVIVVAHLEHTKVWVSPSVRTMLGTTRVSRIGILHLGHFGTSAKEVIFGARPSDSIAAQGSVSWTKRAVGNVHYQAGELTFPGTCLGDGWQCALGPADSIRRTPP
jgi:hypothetical protein